MKDKNKQKINAKTLSIVEPLLSAPLFLQFSLTPLHLACWYGQESVVRLLLEHGANVNAVDRVS